MYDVLLGGSVQPLPKIGIGNRSRLPLPQLRQGVGPRVFSPPTSLPNEAVVLDALEKPEVTRVKEDFAR